MKRQIFLLSLGLFFTYQFGFGQNSYSSTIVYQSGLSFRHFNSSNEGVNQSRANERPIWANGLQYEGKFNLTDRFGLIVGLGTQQYGEQLEFELNFNDAIDPRRGPILPTPGTTKEMPTNITTKYNYHFAVLPIKVSWDLLKSDKTLNLEMGTVLQYNYWNQRKSTYTFEDGREDKHTDNKNDLDNKFNVGLSLGINYEVPVFQNNTLSIGAEASSMILTTSDHSTHLPYVSGLRVGFGF